MSDRAPQERSERRRAAILAAAGQLLTEQGMAAVTHRRVAERAGVSVGSVGYHFSSREELLVQCLVADEEGRAHAARSALDGAGPQLSPHDVGRRVVRTVWGDPPDGLVGRVGAAMDGARESPALQAQVGRERAVLDEDLRRLLEACGYPQHHTELAMSVANGSIVSAGVEGHPGEAFERAARTTAQLLEQLGRHDGAD